MKVRVRKIDGRSSDTSLNWLTETHGKEWEEWRQLAESWFNHREGAESLRLDALILFFDVYLTYIAPQAADLNIFFKGTVTGWKPSSEELKSILLSNTKRSDNENLNTALNYIFSFIDWILNTSYSKVDNNGNLSLLYHNPFERVGYIKDHYETVHSPLPYRYICDLRKILCPKIRGNFLDWKWAYGNNVQSRNWFKVKEAKIDKTDKDCVWRTRVIGQKKVYEIWSPVSAVAVFIKLHLPLRTYQVRMLDSGEADDMRYENGNWIKNTKHCFALKGHRKGVFRRFQDNAIGVESTGLYINTNKTSDQNKDEFERGYEIPWQNENALYWLEKLRNWQEKYNSIVEPTNCSNLLAKHTRQTKSESYLNSMGYVSFLMRDAAASKLIDRDKPIVDGPIKYFWYDLLEKLQNNLLISGDKLPNGDPLNLVHDYGKGYLKNKSKTEFSLHSLRVSLITSYILDAKLPLPVVSKLLAGHSRLLMTVYYTKLTPAVMKEKMHEADKLLKGKSTESIRTFLKDAEMRQIKCKTAFHDNESIESALVNRNPIGWEKRHHGLCLAGGNTVKSNEVGTIAGCWNGGEIIQSLGGATRRVHGPVLHGAENCVRCRWFITDASYLPALNAHLNFMSYRAHEAANLAVKIEGDIESLEDIKYQAEIVNKPFMKHNELQALQRRHEKQLTEADEYVKDLIATFDLIYRLIEIEQGREEGDTQNKLVAVGSENDIKIGFTETKSDLLHLSLLCEDAEIYPDLLDDVKKTSAIQDRTQILSQIMMRKGFMPLLVSLDSDQQLIAANAMMRQMALQANPTDKVDGYHQVANYLDLEVYMKDEELLSTGMNTLAETTKLPITGIAIKSLSNHKVGVVTHAD